MIKKPFRFLKNLMRWYEKEGENILKQIRSEVITAELWKKAEDNFNKRGLPVPIYENHNEEAVVGQVHKIEARNDGLYVAEHELGDRGLELVENGEYPLPSGDFVIHYGEDGDIIDLEVFGVSLVNNEGAKDVELVTMRKDGERLPVSKIKTIQKKGAMDMDKEEILALLSDDAFIDELPDDIVEKIVEKRDGAKETAEEETETKPDGAVIEKEEETVEQEKVDKRKLIDEVGGILKSQGVGDEIIRMVIEKMEEESYDESEAGNEADMSKDEEEDKKEEMSKTKQSKRPSGVLYARMNKLNDAIAEREYKDGVKIVPSSLDRAKRFITRNYADIPENSLIPLALNQCSFFGGVKTETVTMKKSTDKQTPDDILLSLGGR